MPILSWEDKNKLASEVWCDDRFIVVCKGRYVHIIKTETVACAFFVPHEGMSGYDLISLLFKKGMHQHQIYVRKQYSWDLFQKISSYGRAYDNMQCRYIPFEQKLWGVAISINRDTVTISREVLKFFKKVKEEKVYRTQDIIWYEECSVSGGEDDFFEFWLYMLDGTIISHWIGTTGYYDFRVPIGFRNNIPHLLYGWNPEYKKIFEKDPKELMELAKDKMRTRRSK